MYNFHEGLYTDVRIEDVFQTKLNYRNGVLNQQKERKDKGAFIRVYDGKRWYYSSTTEVDRIQEEIDLLSKMASPDDKINDNPVVKNFEVHKKSSLVFGDCSVEEIDIKEKKNY